VSVSSDDELLLELELELLPRFRSFAGLVDRIATLRDHSLEAKSSDCFNDIWKVTRQFVRQQNTRVIDDLRQSGTALSKRLACEIGAVQV
jgi:hypothetical protein